MSALHSRGAQLAVGVAAALVIVIGLAAAGAFTGCSSAAVQKQRPSGAVSRSPHGAVAHVTAKAFAGSIGPRAADTWGEIKAREFITGAFQQYGYFPITREFIVPAGGRRVHSANIVAVKQGESAKQLIVGAHYDTVPGRQGYIDNATGIGLLLETAGRIKPQSTPYAIVFVAFGAEEPGNLGSREYLRTMSALDRRATIGMIDLDAVAGGDQLSVTSRFGGPTWLRDDVLAAAQMEGVPMVTSPAAPGRPAGVSVQPSDDSAFADADLATALISSVDWKHSGRHLVATARDGRVWHTAKDSITFMDKAYPGRVRSQLTGLSRVLETLLTSELKRTP